MQHPPTTIGFPPMLQAEYLSKLHSIPFPRATHCGPNGAFIENVPLLRAVDSPFSGRIWVPRQSRSLDFDLGSAYCLEVDARQLASDLCLVAGALNKGDISGAQSILSAIGLPSFPQSECRGRRCWALPCRTHCHCSRQRSGPSRIRSYPGQAGPPGWGPARSHFR